VKAPLPAVPRRLRKKWAGCTCPTWAWSAILVWRTTASAANIAQTLLSTIAKSLDCVNSASNLRSATTRASPTPSESKFSNMALPKRIIKETERLVNEP
jgi:hypothetical protein